MLVKKTEWFPLESLTPIQGQLKTLSEENYLKLRQEIIEKGFTAPFFIWKHYRQNKILDGTQRFLTLSKMREEGFEIPKVPCVLIDAKSEKRAREILLGFVSQFGKVDKQGLYEFAHESGITPQDMQNFDFPDFDFDGWVDDYFVDKPPESDGSEDEAPEPPKEAKTKPGDLYILGNHRLLCGDSTNIDHVERLMDGQKADMVFTDPPYGMKLDTDFSGMKGWYQGKKYDQVKGDHDDFTPDLIHSCFQFDCKELFLWGADYYAEHLPDKNEGSWLVWDKRVDESKDKMYGSGFELCWSKNKHQRRIIRKMWAGFMGDAEASRRLHPTQKPTELIKYIFDEWCENLTKTVDLYGGSGSTLIACEKTNRKCFMMELDPIYCDVIISRWCKYTGENLVNLNGKNIVWNTQD